MNKALQRYVDAATGLTDLTRKRAESVVKSLVKQGEIAADSREKTIEDLLARVGRNRKVVASLVKAETQRAVEALGVARKAEVERLEAKVAKLEAAARSGGSSGTAGAKKSAKKTSAATKSAARASGTKRAQAAAGGSAVKKSATKKTSAAKTARAKKTTPPPGDSSASGAPS